MASYLNQSDSGGNCCDCPDRAGPCDDCGCPPAGVAMCNPCGQAVCFEVKLDSDDSSDGDFVDFQSGSDTIMGVYFPGGVWRLYAWDSGPVADVTATDPYDTWHSFVVQLTRTDGGYIDATLSVDGGAPHTIHALHNGTDSDSLFSIDNIEFGNQYQLSGTGAHRSIRNIKVRSGNDCLDFTLPGDSFDSFVGGASIVGTDLRIDSESADAYAQKDAGPCQLLCDITVTLSGFSFDCECIDQFDAPYPAIPTGDPLARWLWSDPYDINTSYTLTADPNDATHWELDSAGLVHLKTWTFIMDPNCPNDPPFGDDDVTFHMDVYCVDGEWSLFVTFGASPISLFFHGSGSTDETISNDVSHCGFPEFLLTMGGFSQRFIGASGTGTAIVTTTT